MQSGYIYFIEMAFYYPRFSGYTSGLDSSALNYFTLSMLDMV
jgi:hypothetical protein